MKIIIEGHKYAQCEVQDYLWEGAFRDIQGYVSIGYVGYYYNPDIADCVFILPKVLLEDKAGQELVFGKYRPEDILSIDEHAPLAEYERKFIYEFSVWIHRAIMVYALANPDNQIVLSHRQVSEMGNGRPRQSCSFLDVLLGLIQFQHDNRDFILFTLRNIHSGYDKIDWRRTITHEQAYISRGKPLYLRVENRKRIANFDEELLVIYYSILSYIREQYGFPVDIPIGFDLIRGTQFEKYIAGYGCLRLRQIKYKYFSDLTLQLWELCYAFFEHTHQITLHTKTAQYLLVSSFEIVFEAMIDKLIGSKREELPDGLKDQDDGKRVDHLYSYKSLTDNDDPDRRTFYIGDSKYYKRHTPLGKEAIYKQYTYAKNMIQWNLNLFLNSDEDSLRQAQNKYKGLRKLRDDTTEGYDITPNFFISARINDHLDYQEQLTPVGDNKQQTYNLRQFENRLFDRDTLLLAHYDVNFLHIVSLYARNNRAQQQQWKEKVRQEFRRAIQQILSEQYHFYAITPRAGVNAEQFLQANFQQLLGKVYAPYDSYSAQPYYSVALEQDQRYEEENEGVLALLEPSFYIAHCPIGTNPTEVLPHIAPRAETPAMNSFLSIHYIQRYLQQNFLIGCYKNEAHLQWILGKNDKGTLLYNVRIHTQGHSRDGVLQRSWLEKGNVRFVILYNEDTLSANLYRVFHVHHHAVMSEERMRKALYPNPTGNYFCFVFDEEVQLMPHIDVAKIVAMQRLNTRQVYIDGTPIILSGNDLQQYFIG